MLVGLVWFVLPPATPSLSNTLYTNLTPLTSTDEWESDASYSPDGRYVVFQRYQDNCHSHLWLKDVQSHQEYQLTLKQGVYGRPSWSMDGKQLVFSQRNVCVLENTGDEFCWTIGTLDVSASISKARSPHVQLSCQAATLSQAKWLPNGTISFLSESPNLSPTLQVYDPIAQTRHGVFASNEHEIYGYDINHRHDELAIFSVDTHNQHWLTMTHFNGSIKARNPILLPDTVSRLHALQSAFHPSGSSLLASSPQAVFTLYKNGHSQPVHTAGRRNLSMLSYHPDGDSLLATEVRADTDIGTLSLEQLTDSRPMDDWQGKRLARSNQADDSPRLQPHGNALAFTSLRSGTRQAWLLKEEQLTQLSSVKSGLKNKSLHWSPSGEQIAAIAEDQLHIWSLQGQHAQITPEFTIETIQQWVTAEQLLVTARTSGDFALYLYTPWKHRVHKLLDKKVLWARMTQNNQLLYLDEHYHFWLAGEKIQQLNERPGLLEQPRPVLFKDTLYGVDKKHTLWSFSLAEFTFNGRQQLPANTRYIADANEQVLLFTYMHKLHKDLVAITP